MAVKSARDRVAAITIGHLPLEISRQIFFFVQHGGMLSAKVNSTARKRSPIVQGGLEIEICLTVKHKEEKILKRLLEVIKEPVKVELDTEHSYSHIKVEKK